MKITKKINHDSMWIKVEDQTTKSWGKVLVNRSGVQGSVKCTPSEKATFNTIVNKMFRHMKSKDGTYGEKIESLYVLLNQS